MTTSTAFQIRPATPEDLPHLASIETSAAALFSTIPALTHWSTSGPSFSQSSATALCAAGTLWVATTTTTNTTTTSPPSTTPPPPPPPQPVAFLAATSLDKSLYIVELSVHASFQNQGIGTRLLQTAIAYARGQGYGSVSLITEREVAWNGPMYARRGFRVVADVGVELGPGHQRVWDQERDADGMDMGRRVGMVLELV